MRVYCCSLLVPRFRRYCAFRRDWHRMETIRIGRLLTQRNVLYVSYISNTCTSYPTPTTCGKNFPNLLPAWKHQRTQPQDGIFFPINENETFIVHKKMRGLMLCSYQKYVSCLPALYIVPTHANLPSFHGSNRWRISMVNSEYTLKRRIRKMFHFRFTSVQIVEPKWIHCTSINEFL